MSKIFEGPLQVHYGQAYILPDDMCGLDLNDSFRGQVNGLCGAATPGALFLLTGQHTGQVGFTLEVFETAPAIDAKWEEIVEVSLEVCELGVSLVKWEGEEKYPIPLSTGCYRVRYCALDMQQGQESFGDEGIVDFYYLCFWPSTRVKDAVVKQTSQIAQYWHESARKL